MAGVISEILRLRKNRYSHIDLTIFNHKDTKPLIRNLLCALVSLWLRLQEVFDDLPAFRILLVKELGMELDTVETATLLLHRLDLTGLV